MDDSLPTDVAELQALLVKSRDETRQSRDETRQRERALALAQQQATELTATVEQQRGKLEAAQQQIVELLRALRGKQRERIDPCLLYTSPSPRDLSTSRMPSSA